MTTQRMTLEIDETMNGVLDAFVRAGGYATTGYLVSEVEKSRPTVTKRLDKLSAADCIEYQHERTAFWKLICDPREEDQ